MVTSFSIEQNLVTEIETNQYINFKLIDKIKNRIETLNYMILQTE